MYKIRRKNNEVNNMKKMVGRSGQEVTDVVGLFYARASLTEPPLRLAKDAPSVPVSWSSIGHRPTGSLAPLGADSKNSDK